MRYPPIVVALPIADRLRSYVFYTAVLDLEPIGEPAEDGVPEPLQFAINDGVRLMLVPSGGFGWVIGDHDVAQRGHSECLLNVSVDAEPAVGDVIERARQAGATIIAEPGQQPWGYVATFADPDGHLWQIAHSATPPRNGSANSSV